MDDGKPVKLLPRMLRTVLGTLAVVAAVLWIRGISPAQLFQNPPLEILCRGGVLSDNVIQVRNDSGNPQTVSMSIYEGDLYDVAGSVSIAPGEVKEFGCLEFRNQWRPKAGNKGFVTVRGYQRVATFELLESGKYMVDYCFGVPDDAPQALKDFWSK